MSSVPYTFAGDTGNIPLEYLDLNFANVKLSVDYVIQNAQANITSVGTLTSLSVSGNVLVAGNVSVAGNTLHGNILTSGAVSAAGNVTGANYFTAGLITSTGNITGGNIRTAGAVTATGNVLAGNLLTTGAVTAGNVLTTGVVSATGNMFCNVITASNVNATNISLSGNIVVAGNAQVNGTTTFINTQNLNITDKNITIANGVSTSALIDGAGIDAGNPTVAYIRYSHANVGWGTANNFNIGGNLSVTGNAFAATPANGLVNNQVATTAYVAYNGVPQGGIIMWSGLITNIPSGWFLCDGGNGTPDLRSRFVVGAGSTYGVGDLGGSANAVLVSHSHTATSSVTDPGHFHQVPFGPRLGSGNNASDSQGGSTPINTSSNTTGITVSTTVSTEGSSATNANLPPYYALAYIMKA